MATFDELVTRTLREWLEPPERRDLELTLDGALNNSATTIPVDESQLSPEEQGLLGPGIILEVNYELIRAGTWDDANTQFTNCVRGVSGTTAASHSDGDTVSLNPKWTRQTIYDALADTLVESHPPLFGVTTESIAIPSSGYAEPTDNDIYMIQEVTAERSNDIYQPKAKLLRHNPANDGYALMFSGAPTNATAYVTFRQKLTRPTDPTDTLSSCNAQDNWGNLLIVGALSKIIGEADLDAVESEYLTAMLEVQNVPVGAGSSLRSAFSRYYDRLEQKAARRLNAEYNLVKKVNGWVVP